MMIHLYPRCLVDGFSFRCWRRLKGPAQQPRWRCLYSRVQASILGRVSKPCPKNHFPSASYPRCIPSNILCITMGYLFLVNVVVVLAFLANVLGIQMREAAATSFAASFLSVPQEVCTCKYQQSSSPPLRIQHKRKLQQQCWKGFWDCIENLQTPAGSGENYYCKEQAPRSFCQLPIAHTQLRCQQFSS